MLAEELEQALDLASIEVQLRGAPRVELGSSAAERLRVPISAHSIDFGSLTLGLPASGSFTPEDRVVAEKLALQASVAADNQRLLVSELERAALHAELEHTRGRLATHLRNVSQILDSQETERAKSLATWTTRPRRRWPGFSWIARARADLDQEVTRSSSTK